ncbi:MAG: flagellar basal body-associated FliL family protein [Minwuia sp.]|nr:flagellar basal body-associated FliL family protein [Minwuia sp.]
MAEESEEADVADAADADSGQPRKRKLSGKVLVLFIALPVLVLLGGGGAAFMMLGGGNSGEAQAASTSREPVADESHAEEKVEDDSHVGGSAPVYGRVNYAGSDLIFYELPDMLVNLNSDGRQPRFLKIRVALEFGDKSIVKRIERVMPRIVDHFQVYLRELRREDLQGSAGVYRLKEELMIRVNQSVRPARVRDVLFKEMLIQ